MRHSSDVDSEKVAGPEYTLGQTIEQLAGWQRGERMYPIEVAVSAVHWMTGAPQPLRTFKPTMRETLAALNAWLADERPELPEDLALLTLYWLRAIYEDSRP